MFAFFHVCCCLHFDFVYVVVVFVVVAVVLDVVDRRSSIVDRRSSIVVVLHVMDFLLGFDVDINVVVYL